MEILKQTESKPRIAGKGHRKDIFSLVEDEGGTFIDIRTYDCDAEGNTGRLFSRIRAKVTGTERINLLMIHSQQFPPMCRKIAANG